MTTKNIKKTITRRGDSSSENPITASESVTARFEENFTGPVPSGLLADDLVGSGFGAAFSDVSEHWYMNDDISFVNFRQKLYDVQQNRKRNANIFGKIYNRLTGSKTDVVELSGAVLRSAIGKVASEKKDEINAMDCYYIPFEVAEGIFSQYFEALQDELESVKVK